MTWTVTVPLFRAGKAIPIAERTKELERFKGLTGSYFKKFATETEASDAAYLWSQVLGFSVEAKKSINIPEHLE